LIISKYKLPNRNVLLWLGPGTGIEKNLEIENALVLAGGEVLRRNNVISIPRDKQEAISDFLKEEPESLARKYGVPISRGLIEELKNGVVDGSYPPFKQSITDRNAMFKKMIAEYIHQFQIIEDLEEIIDMCQQEINNIRNK